MHAAALAANKGHIPQTGVDFIQEPSFRLQHEQHILQLLTRLKIYLSRSIAFVPAKILHLDDPVLKELTMEPELVITSSPTDTGVSCWDLQTGAEHLLYKSCTSTPHGLASVAVRFLTSSQVRDAKSFASGSILYWNWNKSQVKVRSFPVEPIRPLACNSKGTYIAVGGVSGDIYFWEVATGKLLKNWHVHYRAVSCLRFNDDQSLLMSGADDGCVRVWSLFLIFDDARREEAKHLFEYSFNDHSLKVTDIKTGYGGCNAITESASEDCTCKVWSLSKGKLLRNIVFPFVIP